MTVSSSTNKVSYSGNGSLTTFAYTFKIFDQSDVVVILRAADGTETVQTITTHYTVTGVGSASGGNVVFGSAPASGVTVVILRSQPLTQGLDLVANDPFDAESLEEALDKLVFMSQKHEEELSRTIKGSRTNVISNSEFTVSATDRANKLFSFDSAGNLSIAQELGTFRGNWASGTAYNPRDIVKDTSTNNIFLVNTAHTSSGSQPLTTNANSAKYDLIVDAASSTTAQTAAAASAATATTKASEAATSATASETAKTASETAKTASETAQTAAEAALDSFDDRYLGAKSTSGGNPTVDNDGNALIDGALFFDTTNNVLMVYNLGTTTWLRTTPTSSDQTAINAVNSNASNINTVAGVSSNVTTVAGISANVTTVAGDTTEIGVIASDLGGSNTIGAVAGIASNVTTVAGISSAVSATAGKATEIGLLGVSSVITDMGILGTTDVVADMAILGTADVVNDMNVLGTSANVTAMSNVSGGIANVNTVASDLGGSNNVGTVAGSITNVNNCGGSITQITTVANNLSTVTDFFAVYRTGSSDPTSSLDTGDLFYNTTSGSLKVYNGSAWESCVTAGSGFLALTGGTLSGDLSGTNVTLSGYLRGPSSFTIDPATHGDNTGTLIVAGNLQVDGTTSTINSTTLTVDDKNIVVASGAADAAAANGAGLTVDGASATFNYASSGDKWTMNKPLDVTGTVTATALTVDEITIDGDTITATDDFLIDVVSDIKLDANGGHINFFDNGTAILTFQNSSTDAVIQSRASDRDLIFKGNDGGSVITALTLDMSEAGAATFNSTISDADGKIRAIPQSGSDKTSSYSLVVGDVGNFIGIGSGGSITVPNSTFAAGDAISIFNNTSGDRTITLSISTAYIAGTDGDVNSVTLASRGVCTILFISGTVCVVSGNVS